MTSPKENPNSPKDSDQADNIFGSIPGKLPDEAHHIYYDAYQDYIAKHGNNPEIAHQTGMEALMREYNLDEKSGEWRRK